MVAEPARTVGPNDIGWVGSLVETFRGGFALIGNVINHVIGHVIRSRPAVKPNSFPRGIVNCLLARIPQIGIPCGDQKVGSTCI
jgi:hypothetical protein